MAQAPPFFKAKNLSIDGVKHGFFGAKGGVSTGIYASLNCGYGSNDAPENITENRTRIAGVFGIEKPNLINPYQIHSAECAYICSAPKDAPRLDAYVTDVPNLAIAILTADCAPILFCDADAKVIGAAHAGWQGAISGIIEATIDCMKSRGANVQNISAAIGPCIDKKSYQVGAEYRDRFIEQNPDNERYFEAIAPHDGAAKFLFDLKSYCAMRLGAVGIERIEILPHDTCAQSKDFFSNRRRTIKGEPDYGRNLSAIMLSHF